MRVFHEVRSNTPQKSGMRPQMISLGFTSVIIATEAAIASRFRRLCSACQRMVFHTSTAMPKKRKLAVSRSFTVVKWK